MLAVIGDYAVQGIGEHLGARQQTEARRMLGAAPHTAINIRPDSFQLPMTIEAQPTSRFPRRIEAVFLPMFLATDHAIRITFHQTGTPTLCSLHRTLRNSRAGKETSRTPRNVLRSLAHLNARRQGSRPRGFFQPDQ